MRNAAVEDLSALVALMEATAGIPEVYEPGYGETADERAAREAAAADITDVVLDVDDDQDLEAGVERLAALCSAYADLIERQALERVSSWIPGEAAE